MPNTNLIENYQLDVSNYRKINLEIDYHSQSVYYSQGETKVMVKDTPDAVKLYKNDTKCFNYSVANTADRINGNDYRKGRRHYEIVEFLERNLKADLVGTSDRYLVFVYSTDGSSRTCAINAVAAKLAVKDKKEILPLAISFGYYEGKLVYDLNYIQDSLGEGDCAMSGIWNKPKQTFTFCNVLYEGMIPHDLFIVGLEQSISSIKELGLKLCSLTTS